MPPLQNFIEESTLLFVKTPSSPTGSLSRNPINTEPVTVDYKTSRKTTPKTTTRGQNINVSPVIITTTTNTVSAAMKPSDSTTAFPTKAAVTTTAIVPTSQATAFPTKAVQVTTATAGDGASETANTTSGGTDDSSTTATGKGDWDSIISEVIPTKPG